MIPASDLPHPLLSEAMTTTAPKEPSGSWDSIHVFETSERGRQAHYKLTSTVMLQLVTRRGDEGELEERGDFSGEKKGAGTEGWKREGEVSLSGSMTRQVGCIGVCAIYESLLTFHAVGTGLANRGLVIAHNEHGQDGRGDGNKDEKSFARGTLFCS